MTALQTQAQQHDTGSSPTLRPQASQWATMLRESAARRPNHAALFRQELGLPTDRPIVMTGHQAQVWHPGILAKYLAADAIAARTGAAAAWIVVDQDANPPGVIRLPVRRAPSSNGGRTLRVETWPIDPRATREHGDVPTARQPGLRVGPAPTLEPGETWAAPGVAGGIETIRAALSTHAQAPSVAAQMAAAVAGLLAPLVRIPGHTVLSLAISHTTLFREMVDRIRRDPAACTTAYNAAVAAHPRERIQPLGPDELPLWVIGPERGAVRRKAMVNDLGVVPVQQFAPRALLMTGLLRCSGCDLFIHGTGGGGAHESGGHDGYDRITEQWFSAWLGCEAITLAPSVVATATLHLRIDHDGPGAEQLRRAQWLAHRAMHDPKLLGDTEADDRKREMIVEIRRLKLADGDARTAYRTMHAMLDRTRAAHGERLRELQAEAGSAAGRLGDAEIAADRTWAFPLYESDQIAELRTAIDAAFT